ncbi:MAG: NUDIX hydrolase [Bdellovibrionales bacterium]
MNVQPGINLRTYGILRSADGQQVLLIDEFIMGKRLLKFPGGGVEHAEAPGLALIREFKEELNVEIVLGELFYVSPHFHRSFFRPQQLLALYWDVRLLKGQPQSQIPHLNLLWRPLNSIKPEEMTHPVDQEVVSLLLARCGGT